MKWTTLLLLSFLLFNNIINNVLGNGTAEVVVFGDPGVYPREAQDKTIPATIRVFNRPTYSYLIVSIAETSSMPGVSVNYPVNSTNTDNDLELRKADNVARYNNNNNQQNDRWEDLGNGRLKYTLPNNYPPKQRKIEVNIRIYCNDYGGLCYYQMGDYDKALVSLRRSAQYAVDTSQPSYIIGAIGTWVSTVQIVVDSSGKGENGREKIRKGGLPLLGPSLPTRLFR